MTPDEILDKAADVIERNGWYQGDFCNSGRENVPPKECEVCVFGAILVAANREPTLGILVFQDPTARAFAAHLGFAGDTNRVTRWNDDPTRTSVQVVHELRACAANLRAAVTA